VRITDAIHLNTSPVWTPDGGRVLFVSSLGGTRDIYAQKVNGNSDAVGAPVRLTTGLNPHTISLSADGGHLAYSAFTTTANVWSASLHGFDPIPPASMREITFGNQTIEAMSVSPDGHWLAYDSNLSGNSDIYKIGVEGGEPQQLTHDPADDFVPVWSPDGSEIAFHSFRNGTRDIFLMSTDGSRTETVVASPRQERNASWSPDGRSIVFEVMPDSIFVVARAGAGWGSPRFFKKGFMAAWSPDGKTIGHRLRGNFGARSGGRRTRSHNRAERFVRGAGWRVGVVGGFPHHLSLRDRQRRNEFPLGGTRDGERTRNCCCTSPIRSGSCIASGLPPTPGTFSSPSARGRATYGSWSSRENDLFRFPNNPARNHSMRMKPLFSALLFLAYLPSPLHAQSTAAAPKPRIEAGFASDRLARIDQFLQRYVDDNQIAGAVGLVMRDGRMVYQRAVGWADKEAGRRMTPDAIFRIASQSKALTSTAILALVEEGKIGLEDPVSRYIPQFAHTTVAIRSDSLTLSSEAPRTIVSPLRKAAEQGDERQLVDRQGDLLGLDGSSPRAAPR